MESGEVKKYYVWETTSRKGTVEVYLAETEEATYFESGRFASKEQWESGYLRQIDEEEYKRRSLPEPTLPPPSNENAFAEWEKMLGNPGDPVPTQQPETKPVEINPIRVILDRQKKKESVKIPIMFTIEIPAKKVMNLLDMMFDREEITQELIKSVTSKLNVDSIVNEIETQIRTTIEKSYEEEDKKDDE